MDTDIPSYQLAQEGTGAAYAAQLVTMQTNEEVDDLRNGRLRGAAVLLMT